MADTTALFLRLIDAGEACKKALGGVDPVDGQTVRGEPCLDLVALVEAQHAGVDEDRHGAVTHRLAAQQRGDRGVDAARQADDDPPVADLGANRVDGVAADQLRGPVAARATEVQEVLEYRVTPLGVAHLGVELDAV